MQAENRQHEPSLRDRDPCRVSVNPGTLRHSPGSITHGQRCETRDSDVKASFARATTERSVAGERRRGHGSSLGLS